MAIFTHAKQTPQIQNALKYCVSLTQRHDYEAYLCGLLLPRQLRNVYWGLRALNVESALVKEQCRGNVQAGEMRFQYWHDNLEAIFHEEKRHTLTDPVALGLGEGVSSLPGPEAQGVRALGRRLLERSLEARRLDLQVGVQAPPPDVRYLDRYAEKTVSSILMLMLEAAGVHDESADHAAYHLGLAVGWCTILRAAPHVRQMRQVYLPQDLLRKHSISVADLLPDKTFEKKGLENKLKGMCQEAALHASNHLREAAAYSATMPKTAYPVMMPAVGARLYLSALEKNDHSIYSESMINPYSKLSYQLRLLKACTFGPFS